MSYDFDTTPSPCDHLVLGERLRILEDAQTLCYYYDSTLPTRAPIQGPASVSLALNHQPVAPDHPIYGWSVLPTALVNGIDARNTIKFKNPVRLRGVLVTLDYRTTSVYCLRCEGSGYVKDFKISNKKSLIHITGHDKLVQRVLKFLLTSQCDYYPTLVCQIKNFISRKLGNSLTPSDISAEVDNAIQKLVKMQATQREVQSLSPSEILKKVEASEVVSSDADPTKILVTLSVSTYGQPEPESVSFALRISQ